ncbi:uncharacterized protein LOC117294746 [Asterias rubens]|uniref:uncharacterized protein LOC117294746 n=1 Tax=Asterias rubens TaxID=7604 RepID=UPI0014550E44|nr:uncharacterized protein LOC117294746 [Asterias rubens]
MFKVRHMQMRLKVLRSRDDEDGDGNTLSKGVKKTSPIYKMDPILKDGLLRVGGRLSRALLSDNAKHAIILPKAGHVSTLILRHVHKICGHSGRSHVHSSLQQKYWMPGANSSVRRIIGKCVTFRKQRARVMEQKMADLPSDRLRPDEPPFTRVGMDYFSPFDVKRGRSVVKRYGVMFTCLASRAVHIKKADSLDTDHALMPYGGSLPAEEM